MLAEVYKALSDKIAQLEEISFVDWYNQQERRNQKQHEMDTPAVFIEFLPFTMEGENHGAREKRKRIALRLRLHLVTRNISSGHQGSPERDDALLHYEVLDKLMAHLEAWGVNRSDVTVLGGGSEDGPVLNRLSIAGIRPDHGQSQIIRTVLEAKSEAFLYLKKKETVKWGVKKKVTTEVTLPSGTIGGNL